MTEFKVSNGTSFVTATSVKVSNGSSFSEADAVWVSNGDGTWSQVWPNTSTASVTGPAWVLSTSSGAGSAITNVIKPAGFTVTLSQPTAVSQAVLEGSYQGAAYQTLQSWSNPATSVLTVNVAFYSVGTWSYRVRLVLKTAATVYSSVSTIECYAKSLAATPSDSTPDVGDTNFYISAYHIGTSVPVSAQSWWYSYNNSSWTKYTSDTNNPLDVWYPTNTTPIYWVYQEILTDGSVISSPSYLISPQLAQVTVNGGTGDSIQAGLDQAYGLGVPLVLTGTFSGLSTGVTECRIPAGARVTATGATINGIQFFNADTISRGAPVNYGGAYNRAGNIVWDGGTFNCTNPRDAKGSKSTAFSISHCPSFTLQNATIYNTPAIGHGIEINSSGGAAYGSTAIESMPESAFTIKVLNCRFGGMTAYPRTSCKDEAVHLDYAWSGATAAGCANDGTPCHNVLVKGNRFERLVTYPYPVAFGNHKTNGDTGEADMASHHSHLRFTENVTQWTGASETSWDLNRGSVDLRGVRYVHIYNNQFLESCTAIGFNAQLVQGVGNGYIYVKNNYIRAAGHIQRVSAGYVNTSIGSYTRDTIDYTISWIQTNTDFEFGPQQDHIYIMDNRLTGWVGSNQDTWLIGCRDVDTLWVNSNDFWGLANNTTYTVQTGNRIHGSEAAPSSTVTGYQCRDNTWAPNADGSGIVYNVNS